MLLITDLKDIKKNNLYKIKSLKDFQGDPFEVIGKCYRKIQQQAWFRDKIRINSKQLINSWSIYSDFNKQYLIHEISIKDDPEYFL